MSRTVERCLRDARADHERQGGLDEDDLYRLVAAHGLDADDTATVRQILLDEGVLDRNVASDDSNDLDQTFTMSDDAVGALLKRASRTRLLTAEEEVSLGRRIALGISATESGRDDAESRRLVRDGLQAKEVMILANVRLAFSVAKNYQGHGLDLEDLLHEAILGLIRATEKYDHTLGYKFSTYATWWLRQAITRALADKGRLIRLPVHYVEIVTRVQKTQRHMTVELGRTPHLGELAEYLEMDRAQVQAVLDHARQPVSLNIPVADDGTELEYLIPAQTQSVESLVMESTLRDLVHQRLGRMEHLSKGRAAEVLRRRHGFDTDAPQTLDEIGVHFGVTRERVRQIESKAYTSARSYFSDVRDFRVNV